MNKRALFSDTGEYYVTPAIPLPGEKMIIRLRTGKENIKEAVLRIYENDRAKTDINARITMEFEREDDCFRYYATEIIAEQEVVLYDFQINDGTESCIYSALGAGDLWDEAEPFIIIPGYDTPDWAKGAVLYQIFTDRFARGDSTNDVTDGEYIYLDNPVKKVDDWYKAPDAGNVHEFYGGDLKGVIKKLDYLCELGIDAIYFNPLFVSPSNHKYDTQDYEHIDPHFGCIINDAEGENRYAVRTTDPCNLKASDELFITLVEEAHKRNIRVILDGVFNHCGSWNRFMDAAGLYKCINEDKQGAYISGESPYKNYFRFNSDSWPYNDDYEGWWGYDTLPKLNYEGSEELLTYITDIGVKWVSPPYNADGWRLDVAADIGHGTEFNHRFFRIFRQKIKEANKNAIILAEHYYDPRDWLMGDQWDSIMNYEAFMEPVGWYLTGMEKHCDERRNELCSNVKAFWDIMKRKMSRMPHPSLMVSMNELSNHDHARFLTRTAKKVGRTDTKGYEEASVGINKALMRAGVMIQMTWPGAPTVYYGDEAGLCGFTDPDNRRAYPWGREDQEMLLWHKKLIKLHKEHVALKRGSLKDLKADDTVLAYGRFCLEERLIILINPSVNARTVDVAVAEIGVTDETMLKCIIWSDDTGFRDDEGFAGIKVDKGKIRISVPSFGSVILQD